MTPEEFQRLWEAANRDEIRAPSQLDFHLAVRLTRHSIFPHPNEFSLILVSEFSDRISAAILSAVALLQIRRGLAGIDIKSLEGFSERDNALTFPTRTTSQSVAHRARIGTPKPGRAVLRLEVTSDAFGLADIRLDRGLAETLHTITHGANEYAEHLAVLDESLG